MNKRETVFVTGASGLVGSHLVMLLLEKGYHVLALVRSENYKTLYSKFSKWYNKPPDYFDQIEWVKGSFSDIDIIIETLQKVTTVFHCGAKVSFHPRDAKELYINNLKATRDLISLCVELGVKNFIYTSSTAAIGEDFYSEKGINETAEWKKEKHTTNYSVSKHLAELEVWRGMEEGLNVGIINPSVIIGPGLWGKSSTSLIQMIANGMTFYTLGSNGFVDVRNVTEALVKVHEQKKYGHRYLMVSENLIFRDLFNLIADSLTVKRPSIYANKFLSAIGWRVIRFIELFTQTRGHLTKETAKSGHVLKKYDNSKAQRELNIGFIPVADSVRHSSDCYLSETS